MQAGHSAARASESGLRQIHKIRRPYPDPRTLSWKPSFKDSPLISHLIVTLRWILNISVRLVLLNLAFKISSLTSLRNSA